MQPRPALDQLRSQTSNAERIRAELDRQTCQELGAGSIAFTPSGKVVEMAPGLLSSAERLLVFLRALMKGVHYPAPLTRSASPSPQPR